MKYILFLASIFLFLSCNEKVNDVKRNRTKPNYTSYIGNEASWDLYFPDTVNLNQSYHGKIVYKGVFDSITTSFDDEHNRYIKVVLMTSDKLNWKFDDIRKTARDTFGAVNCREIPFDKIKFTKPGINYIHGYIIDHLFLEAKGTKPEDSLVRMLENEITVNCEVFVKE